MKPNILFVDDEPMILNGLRRMLRSYRKEWNLNFANSGEEALSFFKKDKYDIIVSDMRMPEITGNTLLREVAAQYPNCVRLILSGHAELSDILDVVAPAHQFHSKPCNMEILSQALKRIQVSCDADIDASVREKLTSIQFLPSTDMALSRLKKYFEQSTSYTDELYQIIESDIAMTAQVIRLVNSSFFNQAICTLDLEQAINILGHDLIENLYKESKIFQPLPEESFLQREAIIELNEAAQSQIKSIPKEKNSIRVATLLSFTGKLAYIITHQDDFSERENELSAFLLSIWGLNENAINVMRNI